MIYVWLIPFFIQGTFILVDEFYFHHRRKLGRWESLGHPLDTLTFAACIAWAIIKPYSPQNLYWFMGLSIFSCIFITKDEWIHAKECNGGETWIHAVLFLLHPIVLFCIGMIWATQPQYPWILQLQFFSLIGYALYQFAFWNLKAKSDVNNLYYNDLGERWYKAQDDPIALLRAESKLFVEWIDTELKKRFNPQTAQLLDVACGGGLFSNRLAQKGWKITAIDLSKESLDIAQKYDTTHSVIYKNMDALALDFQGGQFDAVISLDMLEHVENPQKVISECSRVLKNDGVFFFHTFNRTFMGWLFAVKGIEWVFRNAPKHIHILRLFIKPAEFIAFCKKSNLLIQHVTGVSPKFSRSSSSALFLQGKVSDDFEFHFTSSTKVGYAGIATKEIMV